MLKGVSGKKGYLVASVIFLVIFLIAVLFSFYFLREQNALLSQNLDGTSIERGTFELYGRIMDQSNFARTSAYLCSNNYCYNATSQNGALRECINVSLSEKYDSFEFNVNIFDEDGFSKLEFDSSDFMASDINMNSGVLSLRVPLSSSFLKRC